ncbi:MAG: acetate--CoA ligase family protein [Deltaproteobacteria bacterium]|nr:acetate--CoA ligase family protein [Deltaproteobacteria bacterium]
MAAKGSRDDQRALRDTRGADSGWAARQVPTIVVPDATMVDEVTAAIAALGGRAITRVAAEPVRAAADAASTGTVGVLVADEGAARELPSLATHDPRRMVALVARPLASHEDVVVARDVGVTIVTGCGAFAAALTLLAHGVERPWLASFAGLGGHDQARLAGIEGGGAEGRFVRQGPHIALARRGKTMSPAIPLGDAESVLEAVLALRDAAAAERVSAADELFVENADASLEVLFGPARALSDPASKAALAPYGLPFPTEIMCSSPSAAASAASKVGFPARVALASPDLRFTEHPDLAIDGLRHASGARDAYRELLLRAELLSPEARVLGATVSRSAVVTARLAVRARVHRAGFVVADIAFADEHGRAARDATTLMLPASPAMVRRALDRLAGAPLLARIEEPLRDLLVRVGAFVRDRSREVSEVWLEPVVRLADGRAEVWGARVVVGDVFARALGD